ncbi:uncharacterized protein LOC135388263 [Ornithodoros turicata]|uniref:uncharacterized protein LOC135388263 n=1 Tax=Ornithodoros turicata TaxID=34597 RepID=UPI00313910D9
MTAVGGFALFMTLSCVSSFQEDGYWPPDVCGITVPIPNVIYESCVDRCGNQGTYFGIVQDGAPCYVAPNMVTHGGYFIGVCDRGICLPSSITCENKNPRPPEPRSSEGEYEYEEGNDAV